METPENATKKLGQLFTEGFEALDKINNSSEATNSSTVQCQVKSAIRALEECTRLVSAVDMFSGNEELDEVSSANLRYLLLPALLGKLSLKLASDAAGRFEVVKLADAYFKDFLCRCRDYGAVQHDAVTPYLDQPDPDAPGQLATISNNSRRASDLASMVQKRGDKIRRFQEEKERERRLKELQEAVEKGEGVGADEEVVRDYHLTLLQSNISQAMDELASLQQEKSILQHMQRLREEEPLLPPGQRPPSRRPQSTRKPLQPVIITKDAAMKKVFGAGYPSLPVLTVDEFYEQRVKQGKFPGGQGGGCSSGGGCSHAGHNHGAEQASGMEVDAAVVQEYQEEHDDPTLLARNRAMDEYKDDHRRGDGNRHNRS